MPLTGIPTLSAIVAIWFDGMMVRIAFWIATN